MHRDCLLDHRSAKKLDSAARVLGHSAAVEVRGAKKRVLSAGGRAAIAKAAKERWAKVSSDAKNAVS